MNEKELLERLLKQEEAGTLPASMFLKLGFLKLKYEQIEKGELEAEPEASKEETLEEAMAKRLEQRNKNQKIRDELKRTYSDGTEK